MASKKYTFILALVILFSSASFGQQSDATYDWRDSSKIPTKLLPQHSEFLNNTYPYPARPRDQWELGIGGGYSFISGDISSRPGFGGSLSVRRALSHTISLRASYTGSYNFGLDYRPSLLGQIASNTVNDPYQRIYGPLNRSFVVAYRNAIHQGSLEMIASLLNTSYYRGNPKMDLYVYGGYSFLSMDVDVDALSGSNAAYNISGVNFLQKRSDIRSSLKSLMDLKYESNAGVRNGPKP
jgi:hypothetical protein